MHTVYCFGPFRLDAAVGSLTRGDRPTGLGPRAVGVLQVLLERSNQYVSKSELLDAAWPGVVVEEANLSVQMSAIRRVLAQADTDVRIETLSRRGYRLLGTVVVESARESTQAAEPPQGVAPNNLPIERDPFVGRDAELHALARQWAGGARLISLTGTGGSGKTRLALRHGSIGTQGRPLLAERMTATVGSGCWRLSVDGQLRTDVVAVQFARDRSLALMEKRGAGGAMSV